jgi:hypothetical protein
MWMRSPTYDGFWLLSGLPLGAIIIYLSRWFSVEVMIVWLVLLTQTGHLLSPMALAWSHGGFRVYMLHRKTKFIAVPVTILLGSLIIGWIGSLTLPVLHFDPVNFALVSPPSNKLYNPFMLMAMTYMLWNAYHFFRQAFGILSIYRHKIHYLKSRQIDLWYCGIIILAAMAMPFIPRIGLGTHNLIGWPAHPHPFLDHIQLAYLAAGLTLPTAMLIHEWCGPRSVPRALFILTDGLALILIFRSGLWGFAIIGLNHWLAAIGIAAHIDGNANHRQPLVFALVVIVVGFVLFAALFVDPWKGLTISALHFTVMAVSFRLALGFIHFLYDRWIYRLGNLQVRAAIGHDLFVPPRIIEPFPAII